MKMVALLLALAGAAFAPPQRAHGQAADSVLDARTALYDAIGVAAVRAVGDAGARVLIYSEMHPEYQAVFIRYQLPGTGVVKQLAGDPAIEAALHELWSFSCGSSPAECWRAIVFLVDEGRVTIRLLHEGPVDDRTMYEKDVALTEEFFPGVPVELVPQG